MAINICREIARQVVLAQIASDAGKQTYELSVKGTAAKAARKFGYAVKDAHIQKAIDLINKNRLCGFIYWIEKAPDQNGYLSTVIYFKYNGKQVSFHSFGTITPWKGAKQRWDHGSSRQNCQSLIEEFNL